MKTVCSAIVLASAVTLTAGIATTLETVMDQDQIIAMINTNGASTWQAGKHDFNGMTIDEMRATLGTVVQENAPLSSSNAELTQADINSLPKEYDLRDRWGHCIHPIRNQARCGSCWAFGASEVLSDRMCMAGVDVILSPEWLLECDTMDMGCNGGRLNTVWLYMKEFGIPADKCAPYVSGVSAVVPECSDTCANGKEPKKYKAETAYSVVNWLDSPEDRVHKIKMDILRNGPVEAAFWVFADFMAYKGGVYKHMTGGMMGGHAVKIVGWGEEKGADGKTTPYWTVANSWGGAWGEDGFFRIEAGANQCNIEMNIWAGLPDYKNAPVDDDE